MRPFYKYSLLALALLVLYSCYRRPLDEECIQYAKIPLGSVWTKADIDPQNVTALFYNRGDGKLVLEHRFENSDKVIQSYVNVPVGRYKVVLFNEIRGQINGIGIKGHESLSTLEAYLLPDPNPRTRIAGDTYVRQPEVLASVIVDDFEVTQEMAVYTNSSGSVDPALEPSVNALVGLLPERKVHEFNITVHVRGLNNARMPALADLRNVAESYSFDADRNTLIPATEQFTMNGRTYDTGSVKDGTISTTVYTLGLLGERPADIAPQRDSPVLLDFLFVLVDRDRTLVNQVVDVTNLIEFLPEGHGAATLKLYLELPEALPDVEPEGGSGGSGFETELIDWAEIDVPLKTN